jgi:hypothetical protein
MAYFGTNNSTRTERESYALSFCLILGWDLEMTTFIHMAK